MVRYTWQQATPPLLQPPIIRSIHSINLPRPTWWTTQDLHRDTFDTRAPDDDPLVCCAKEPLMTHAGLHRPKLHHHGTNIPGQYCNRTTQPRHPNHVYKRENTKACTAKYLWRSRRKKKKKKEKKGNQNREGGTRFGDVIQYSGPTLVDINASHPSPWFASRIVPSYPFPFLPAKK